MQKKLILASSSPFRRQLLERLRLAFECRSPGVDETPLASEAPRDYVLRLAYAKAQAIAARHPDALVIGSDQCAVLDGRILGKPGNHARALEQLQAVRGRTLRFHTGLCLLGLNANFYEIDEVPYEVDFRYLDDARLERYLRREQPYDCAGSFKAEGYGVCLFAALRGEDPSALIGLPLLRLIAMLERAGVEVV